VDVEAAARADTGDDAPEVINTIELPRLLAEPPSVASPAGSSAGSTTSAIADPHRSASGGTPAVPPADPAAPRVAGVAPSPVKRYRPGAPPASPHIGARALPAATAPTITPIAPWYRRLAPWTAIVAVVAAIAVLVVVLATRDTSNDSTGAGGRPPAAAPAGTKVVEGARFGIAAPNGWTVGSDPGATFGQFRRDRWDDPRIATSTNGEQALVVAPLRKPAHDPLSEPEVFWSDQVTGIGAGRSVSEAKSIGVHGLDANYVTIGDRSGSVVAVAVETGRGVYLVAFRAPTTAGADQLFSKLIRTFDPR